MRRPESTAVTQSRCRRPARSVQPRNACPRPVIQSTQDRSRIDSNAMAIQPTSSAADTQGSAVIDDAELAARIGRDDQAAFEAMMRQHNGKLFRVARAILKDDAEAEDALQDAYVEAYRHIGDFRGGARLSTWLTRIVIN